MIKNIKCRNRKVQKIGWSYYIALPELWIYNNQISKGENIQAEMTPEGDLIYKGKKKEVEK